MFVQYDSVINGRSADPSLDLQTRYFWICWRDLFRFADERRSAIFQPTGAAGVESDRFHLQLHHLLLPLLKTFAVLSSFDKHVKLVKMLRYILSVEKGY